MTEQIVLDVSGTVVNVVLVSSSSYDPGPGLTLADRPAGVGIGWRYVDGAWVAPPIEVAPLVEAGD